MISPEKKNNNNKILFQFSIYLHLTVDVCHIAQWACDASIRDPSMDEHVLHWESFCDGSQMDSMGVQLKSSQVNINLFHILGKFICYRRSNNNNKKEMNFKSWKDGGHANTGQNTEHTKYVHYLHRHHSQFGTSILISFLHRSPAPYYLSLLSQSDPHSPQSLIHRPTITRPHRGRRSGVYVITTKRSNSVKEGSRRHVCL
jgi:hypothetical protein